MTRSLETRPGSRNDSELEKTVARLVNAQTSDPHVTEFGSSFVMLYKPCKGPKQCGLG